MLSKTVIQRGDVRPEISLLVRTPASVDGGPVITGIGVTQGAALTEGTKLITGALAGLMPALKPRTSPVTTLRG